MKDDAPEPLAPELRKMLDIEADFPAEDAAASDRVWRKVELAIMPGPGGGGNGGGGAAASTGSPSTAPAVSNLGKYVTVALLAFIAGGFAGAGLLHSLARKPAETPVAQTAPPPAPPPAASVEPEPAPAPEDKQATAPAAAPVIPALPHPSAGPKSSPASTTDLARERAIIEVARTAVSRERYAAALEAIDRHAREFPKGQLAEEREGLRVIALARSGQSNEASERGAAFKKRYPQSVLLPATEAATDKSKP